MIVCNRLRGEVPISICGIRSVLVFNVNALVAIESITGKSLTEVFQKLTAGGVSFRLLRLILQCGLAARSPGVSPGEMSPHEMAQLLPSVLDAFVAAFPPAKESAAGGDGSKWDWFELLRVYVTAGFEAGDFWTLTPREIAIRIEGAAVRRKQAVEDGVRQAWLGAILSRAKRIPKLEELLDTDQKKRPRLAGSQPWELQLQTALRWHAAVNMVAGKKVDAAFWDGSGTRAQ